MFSQKNRLIFSLALIFFVSAHAQSKTDIINTIRENFRAINADGGLTKKILSDEEFLDGGTDGGAELTGYYKKDSLVKIKEWIGLSYGNRTREFYFIWNQLFFVYEKIDFFVRNDSIPDIEHAKISTTFEGRYYFNKNKLIEKRITGKRTFDDEDDKIIQELQESAITNSKILNKKSR
jgi:hypothetical protein